jgi:hypothetical protein
MAITYTISRDERLAKAHASGIIAAEEMNRFVDAVIADPELRPGLRGLVDAREAEPDVTVLQLAEVAKKVFKVIDRGLGRIAIVVASRASYRVSKTFTVLARALGIEVDVFTDIAAAEAWLDDSKGRSDTKETPIPPMPP